MTLGPRLRIFIGVSLAITVSLGAPGHAQKTKAQLNTEVGTTFPDQTTGQITPSGVRAFQNDLINSIMPTAPVGNNNFACYDGTTGLLKDCGASPSSPFVANGNIIPGPANTMKGSLDGATTSDITLTACTLTYQFTKWVSGTGWQCGINPVLPSRAVAATLDLSAFNGVTTQGYALPGDGGGAILQKVNASSGFLDAAPQTGTISAAGSAYTNGSYTGVPLASSGHCVAQANVTVSGNAVTAVALIGLKGSGCVVGDVLTVSNAYIGGTGSGFTWTVATVGAPLGSFTDTAGNRWQIAPDQPGYLNVLQFGARGDWTASGGDGPATDNAAAFTSAEIYALNGVGSADAGGYLGSTIIVPKGTYKICGGLITADGSWLRGVGQLSSLLKQCDSDSPSTHFVTLCNPSSLRACFNGRISDIQLFTGNGTPNAGVAMLYTNNSQQGVIVENVTIYAGKRMCLLGDTGFGGAANFVVRGLFCTTSASSVNAQAVSVTYGAAAITFTDTIVESATNYTGSGILISTGGIVSIRGWHSENVATPIFVNIPGANTTVEIFGVTGGSNCTSVITRQGGSAANVTVVGRINPNGCTNAINNAGAPTTGLVVDNTKF
ncbi:hypothetical protein QA649_08945 [Bradyrhizobium sp. CB1717]|uniref:hypothetical protein n=1 Tax=Bradyrhizobium sp. CB1717 TaxID=3039154 RepID=UPI0024B0B195|nr:hypothetical protein [Bradyrhizobium sp. CB1717]WFU26317.1 hypothetical protein QA649_08945 [Bradyrhizobium sp. CB1717]